MGKPKNRKERIDFIVKKLGDSNAQLFLPLTDREVKKFVDENYNYLKEKDDYIEPKSTCLRCNEIVIHHTECGCGDDRAVFSEEDWIDDINSFTEITYRRPEDKEFINNGYKILGS